MTTPPPAPPPQIARQFSILALLNAFALVISARLLLLLSLAGAFTLAVMAESKGDYISLAVLIAYCVLTVIPMVFLDHNSRQRPRE